MSLHTKDFDYHLPTDLIAQHSVEPRDRSRLMVVKSRGMRQPFGYRSGQAVKRDNFVGDIEHKHFSDIVDYLQPGDLVVWNKSKVFKARLLGQLVSSEGEVLRDHTKPVEIFLVRPMENTGVWKVLAKPGKHVQSGTRVVIAEDFVCEVLAKKKNGTILVQFSDDEKVVREKANTYGHIPIPPYVKDELHELEMYQTVYADDASEGSVAAPTAGFHFTHELIERLQDKGVEFAEVTLHVGLGTFLPVKSERIEDHTMHAEWVEVSEETAEAVNKAKGEGRRVIAVGTTTVRTLEGVFLRHPERPKGVEGSRDNVICPYTGDINLFITPGFKFQIVDAMITNFHLPKSTLLMLVSAFAGDTDFMLSCYQEAVDQKYRFFSFGDGMFIY
jgi:S-adenosylmethionine:tRNA ribosyltransferase-isomerase